MVFAVLFAGNQYILWFDISVDDLESVKMSETECDLA